MRRAALAACLTCALAPLASAQPPDQPTVVPAPDAADFMPRYDFHLSAAALAVQDPRFSWDTHFGGSLDVVDYVRGRAGIYVDYEAVLGDEFRLFDPNQGNYTLEANASGRVTSSTEVVGMFHHVSRHLSDRPKRFAVAWNLLGARILQQVKLGDTTIDADLEGGRIVQNSYVDYVWIAELHLQARRPVSPRVGVYGRASGQWFGIDRSVANRGRQAGGVAELGLRVNGKAGAVELFAGAERRVDADPLDRTPKNWALAGFRLLGR
jgi:hypothetical protein